MTKKYVVMRKRVREKLWRPFNIALQRKGRAQKEVRMLNKISKKAKFRIKRADKLTVRQIKQLGTKEDIIRFLKRVR